MQSNMWLLTVLRKFIPHRRALFKKINEDINSFSAFPFGFQITRQPKELGLESSCSKTERLSVAYFVA
jgi:hypothetical protein